MAVNEGFLRVECDEGGWCGGDQHEVELEVRYPDYSGRGAFYSIEATLQRMRREGWTLEGDDGSERAVCPDCTSGIEEEG